MSGANAVLIEFGSQRWRVTPEAAIMRGDCTLDCTLSYDDDPSYNTAYQPLENMRVVTDRLQISTGRILLHELFYLYAKMDVIQALVRGSCPLYPPPRVLLSNFIRLDISEWRYPLRGPVTTILGLTDALLHLMVRLAIFISTDRDRKTHLEQKMPPPPPQSAPPPPSRALFPSRNRYRGASAPAVDPPAPQPARPPAAPHET